MKGFFEERMSSVVATEWQSIGRKHWQHFNGVQVKYDCNAWRWQVIGGANCGRYYDTKWVAQMAATEGSN